MKTYQKTIKQYQLKKLQTDIKAAQINQSVDVSNYVKQFYFDDIEIFESMFILLLNRRNNVEGYVKISQGGTAGTIVDIKLICRYAIEALASNVIMIHNHPSGNVYPSQPDKDITSKVKEALKFMDITLLDHVIVTKDSYYSLADNNEMG